MSHASRWARHVWRGRTPVKSFAAFAVGGLVLVSGAALIADETTIAVQSLAITKILIPDTQPADGSLVQKPFAKPHDIAIDDVRGLYITSNERTGCAGLTIFQQGSNAVLAQTSIDETGVQFHGELEENINPTCNGSTVSSSTETESGTENTPDPGFEASVRMNPAVCLPVVLPASANGQRPMMDGVPAAWFNNDPNSGKICAPLGAESHARHPHGITLNPGTTIEAPEGSGEGSGEGTGEGTGEGAEVAPPVMVYQVIEHSGLRWNADRTAFEVAVTTDEESGLLLEYDITDPQHPVLTNGFLLGHGAHEVTVNAANGLVFQGNHENSPYVNQPNWVDVINPLYAAGTSPYGFIDVGINNAIQGISIAGGSAEAGGSVFGVTHVGEKIFAFDAACVPTVNTHPTADKLYGDNCIQYWVDLRQPFLSFLSNAGETTVVTDLTTSDPTNSMGFANVIHMHNLVAGATAVYATVHAIHNPEHTGSPNNPVLEAGDDVETEHYMGRWVVQMVLPTTESETGSPCSGCTIDPNTKQETSGLTVNIIDLSNGHKATADPNSDSIGFSDLSQTFVHAHFLAVDDLRNQLYVTGEHTGNLAVINATTGEVRQIVPISTRIPNCVATDETGAIEVEEPHVHGVQVDPTTGDVYVSDEGEHCWYESVTVLSPDANASVKIDSFSTNLPGPQEPGTSVELTAFATGGTGSYQYKFFQFDGTQWSVIRDWGTSSSFTWTPTVPGDYRVGVWARAANSSADAPGSADAAASMSYPIGMHAPLTITDVTHDPAHPQLVNTPITLTAAATNIQHNAVVEYKWWEYDGTTWTVYQDWSTSNTCVWTPDEVNPNYRVGVWARYAGNTTDAPNNPQAMFSTEFPISSAPLQLVLSNFTANMVAPQMMGTSITFSATANTSAEYKFWVFDGATWTVVRDWSTTNTFVWTPATANANARVGVWARTAGSTADAPDDATVTTASMAFPISAPHGLPLTVTTILSDTRLPTHANAAVTFTALTANAAGSLQYKWWVYDGTTWTVSQDWSTSSTFAWTPSTANPNYRVGVWVRTLGNTTDAPETESALYSMAAPIQTGGL